MNQALGLVETRGLIASIEAADAGLKAANVKMMAKTKADAALVTIQFVGEVAAVKSAIEAAAAAAARVGEVISTHVIPRPDQKLIELLLTHDKRNQILIDESIETPSYSITDTSDVKTVEDMTVSELRQYVRGIEEFPIKGREISKANKEQLLALLKNKG